MKPWNSNTIKLVACIAVILTGCLFAYAADFSPEKNIVDIIRYQIAFFISRENIYYYHCKSKEWANHVFEKYMNKNVRFIESNQEVKKNKNLKFIKEAKPETATVNKNNLITKNNLNNVSRNINGIKLGKLKQGDIERYKMIFKKSIPDSLANKAKSTKYETRKQMFLKRYPE